MVLRTRLRIMKGNEMASWDTTNRDATETGISDARGLFAALYDEDLPNLHGTFEDRDAAKDRLTEGMKILDDASDSLRDLGWQVDALEDKLFEALVELDSANDAIEARSFRHLADELLRELEGRQLGGDSPERIVEWVRSALHEIGHTDEPDKNGATDLLVFNVTRLGVTV